MQSLLAARLGNPPSFPGSGTVYPEGSFTAHSGAGGWIQVHTSARGPVPSSAAASTPGGQNSVAAPCRPTPLGMVGHVQGCHGDPQSGNCGLQGRAVWAQGSGVIPSGCSAHPT